MIARHCAARTHRLFSVGTLFLVSFFAAHAQQAAQEPLANSIAFWEPSEAKMQPMLAKPPAKAAERRARLRQYFTSFGCTGDHLADVTLEETSRYPALLCSLPGTSDREILVYAAYPRHDVFDGASDGWPDAAMLPMLYHALQAQPRQFTYVFAAIDNNEPHPLAHLLAHLSPGGAPPPVALIDITLLGFGSPGFTMPPDDYQPPRLRPNTRTVRVEAWRVVYLQHIDTTTTSIESPSNPAPLMAAPVFLPEGGRDVPGILIYSRPIVHPGQYVKFSLPAFREDYDYIAYYLADLDTKLDGSL